MATQTACRVFQRRVASSAAALRLSAAEVRSQRNAIFSREQTRQRALYPRIEKIEVSMQGPGLDGTLLIMNRGMSTPLSCARHLTEYHVDNSVLALVDGELWPFHQPLTHSCTLTLLTFKDNDPTLVNQAYWRSCAALLGQVLTTAFKDEYTVELISTPEVPVTSGAFCCDVVLDPELDSWTPSEESLRSLTKGAHQLIQQDLAWEPLDVAPSVALEVFSQSRREQEEVEQRASESPKGTVTLYRCGDHVLLSRGPLVARTGLCSQYEVTALHSRGQGPWGLQRRAQGLSLPLQLQAHHTVWRKLRQRAQNLVEVPGAETVTPPPLDPGAKTVTPPPPDSTNQ
ncbi:39S ribosomal protein L39, mitochondrial [Nematolebias whitei]|uniref:39S ribosomal protein L39, mitochondrial n=1 Tax=Nematolebias whitei TaxID=451745 RepID=UPI00189BCAFE|nr:39S ribosomal protein L39, mitochondrial [Nematolebias whitei]